MSYSTYNQALEMAKIVLQTKPETLMSDARYAEDSARNVADFIESLTIRLEQISSLHKD
jgi:hypothetical protein